MKTYLLNKWLSILTLENDLKSSGINITGTFTWANSFIWKKIGKMQTVQKIIHYDLLIYSIKNRIIIIRLTICNLKTDFS